MLAGVSVVLEGRSGSGTDEAECWMEERFECAAKDLDVLTGTVGII